MVDVVVMVSQIPLPLLPPSWSMQYFPVLGFQVSREARGGDTYIFPPPFSLERNANLRWQTVEGSSGEESSVGPRKSLHTLDQPTRSQRWRLWFLHSRWRWTDTTLPPTQRLMSRSTLIPNTLSIVWMSGSTSGLAMAGLRLLVTRWRIKSWWRRLPLLTILCRTWARLSTSGFLEERTRMQTLFAMKYSTPCEEGQLKFLKFADL